jgi:hypothetical protein
LHTEPKEASLEKIGNAYAEPARCLGLKDVLTGELDRHIYDPVEISTQTLDFCIGWCKDKGYLQQKNHGHR